MIRIGPAGWKYKDWEGVVYPMPAPRGFDALAYIADYFTAVEINSSYYGPPRPATAQKWLGCAYFTTTHNRSQIKDLYRVCDVGVPVRAVRRICDPFLNVYTTFSKGRSFPCNHPRL